MLKPHHLKELRASAIDKAIIDLNFRSLEGDDAYEYLLYSDKLDRRNDGRLSDRWLRRYSHAHDGGWWCNGVDPLTGAENLWGCLKPDNPKTDHEKGKPIKYEHPPKEPTGAFCLQVSESIWVSIAANYGLTVNPSQYDHFWQWVKQNLIPIIITEGAKKAAALLSAGHVAIALPGIWNGVKQDKDQYGTPIGQPYLIPHLELFADGREFSFCFDNDEKEKTRWNITAAIKKTGKILEERGCDVSVITWTGQEKGVDDFIVARGRDAFNGAYLARVGLSEYLNINKEDDRANTEPDPEAYRAYIEKEDEEAIAAECHDEYLEEVKKANHNEKVINIQRKLNQFSYPIDLKLDCEFLPDFVALTRLGIIPETGILNIKSRKGGGKSTQIKHLIAYYRKKGKNVISITPRITLGRTQAVEWDIEWIEGARADGIPVSFYIENCPTIGLCWDSLGKLYGRDWSNTVIIIDEAEQGLSHLVTSSTLKDRRPFVLKTIEEKIPECLSNGGLVILSDADLTDIPVDYIKALSPEDTPIFSIVNTFKPKPVDVEFYTGKKDSVIDDLMEKAEEGKKLIVATDSQKEAAALEKVLNSRYPDKVIFRIDSETCAEKWGKQFVETVNESIESSKPDVLIYTPSMGTGVSITVKHFDYYFGFFFGVLEPSQCRQMLWRDRNPIPRIIWCKDFAVPNGERSFIPETIKKTIYKYNQDALKITDLLGGADGEDDDQVLLKLADFYRDLADEKGEWNNPHLDLYANFKARYNYGISNLALLLRQELIEEGHNVIDYADTGSTNAGIAVKAAKEEIKEEEAIAIYEADDISLETAKMLNLKPNKTKKEQHQVTKAFLREELPGMEFTPAFILKMVIEDNRRRLNGHKLFWHCQNPEKTYLLDRKYLKGKIANLKGVTLLSDFRTYSPKVKLLDDLGLFKLIDPTDIDKEYSCKDEEVIKFRDKACFFRYKLYQSFGLTVTPKTDPIKLIEKLLDRLGLGLVATGQRRVGKERVRFYQLDKEKYLDIDRLEVLAVLDLKYAEIETEKVSRLSQDSQKVIYKSESCDTSPMATVDDGSTLPGVDNETLPLSQDSQKDIDKIESPVTARQVTRPDLEPFSTAKIEEENLTSITLMDGRRFRVGDTAILPIGERVTITRIEGEDRVWVEFNEMVLPFSGYSLKEAA